MGEINRLRPKETMRQKVATAEGFLKQGVQSWLRLHHTAEARNQRAQRGWVQPSRAPFQRL
jgi:hypothetical protein